VKENERNIRIMSKETCPEILQNNCFSKQPTLTPDCPPQVCELPKCCWLRQPYAHLSMANVMVHGLILQTPDF